MSDERQNQFRSNPLAELAKPAQRALAGAGIVRLEQLTGMIESDLLKLHGMGPKALETLRRALAARGLSFAVDKDNTE
jgi:DNA-directed RNA polymerase alpha subunit